MDLAKLVTEERNPDTLDIDMLETQEILKKINSEDKKVPLAVEKEIPSIAKAVDAIAERLGRDGRLFYIGAGTSGRIGVLDASECPPTFGVDPEKVQGIIAGGDTAIRKSMEDVEDDAEQGKIDLMDKNLSPKDAVVGLAASGRTPYVLGAMEYARSIGALTIGVCCTPENLMKKYADIMIVPVVGPEVITGSTRMKAGTAQKLVLNMISTSVMIKLGKVYSNLMVDVRATNEKLVQ
ncbi:MAG TPA: N-acetylmuramic acid 6-phosphate etherase, partial [Thermoanaerobacterales bacterium]|nr:N-acetylmuramic acid 6-phosphate etherase [Thermoanaerobacterales bacterium]